MNSIPLERLIGLSVLNFALVPGILETILPQLVLLTTLKVESTMVDGFKPLFKELSQELLGDSNAPPTHTPYLPKLANLCVGYAPLRTQLLVVTSLDFLQDLKAWLRIRKKYGIGLQYLRILDRLNLSSAEVGELRDCIGEGRTVVWEGEEGDTDT